MPSPWTKSSIRADSSKGQHTPTGCDVAGHPLTTSSLPPARHTAVGSSSSSSSSSPPYHRGAPVYFAGEDRERVNSCLARVTLVVIPAQARTCLVYRLVLAGMAVWKRVITARYLGNYQVALVFSDNKEGILDGTSLLQRHGTLIEALRDENFFKLLFVDMGALCWPNGLELSPARLYENCNRTAVA